MAIFKPATERGFKVDFNLYGEMTQLGVPELQAVFDALPGTLQRKVLREAVRRGGSVMLSAIRKKTPRSRITGTQAGWSKKTRAQRQGKGKDALRKGLTKKPSSKWAKASKARRDGIVAMSVGVNWKIAPHTYNVEHGHRAFYWSKVALSSARVPAHPYFWRAVYASGAKVHAAVAKKTKQRLPHAVAKLVKGKKR